MAFTHHTAQKLELTADLAQDVTPPPAYVHDPTFSTSIADFEESDSDNEPEHHSSIRLQINTPLVVTGDNNLIAIDPSLSASKIAMAVVQALKQVSMGSSGVPMIDEEGRPRPMKVEIFADIKVEGSRNVVGERAVVAAVTSGAVMKRTEYESKVASGSVLGKRERVESELVEGPGKRVCTE